ncbi:MAG: asparagine synthase (glutamine-hydrolyzing) [Nanoarchaeota archaeon]
MCGICGFNWYEQELIRAMNQILYHRGPDRGGIYTDKDISLGQRRLSIIDLSEAGNQPMYNEKKDILIIYNGETYNFKELRMELEKERHRFISNTDTEVILHGYEQWGEKVVEKLNGMFAFCIYDIKEKKLFLARDRLGVKPLYYYWNGKKFIFASEIKALLLTDIPRQINPLSAREYLKSRYLPGEETLFQGIKKLLPGHTLTLKDKQIKIKRYWDIPRPQIRKTSLEKAKNKVLELLSDSVRRRLIADVPVGIYLSGGIDSAAITSLASKISSEPVKTFSVGFDYNSVVDELKQARQTAEHFRTDHQEIVINEPIAPLLPKILWHFDQPHGDPVIIPNYKLSQLASRKVKVVLAGEGADEIFGGYVQYKSFLTAQKIRLIPSLLKANLTKITPLKILDQFFDYPSSLGEKGKEKLVDFFKNKSGASASYQELTSIISQKDKKLLFTEKLKTLAEKIPQFSPQRKPLLNQMLYADLKEWLPNYILYINDRMTMAHSLEGRTPFLDYRLVEYSMTLPAQWKLKKSTTKFILREALKKVLPDTSTKKHAFFMPLDNWLKEELKPLAEELFTPANVKERGYFNYGYLKKTWEDYEKSKLIYGKQLFTLINFELWQRMFIDCEKIPKNSEIKLQNYM